MQGCARYSEIRRHRVRAETSLSALVCSTASHNGPSRTSASTTTFSRRWAAPYRFGLAVTTSAWMRAASEARAGVVCAVSSPTETSKVSPLTRSRMATRPAGFTAQTITSREPWTAIVPQAMRRISIGRTMPGAAVAWRWQTYQWFTDTVERTIDELLTFLTDIPGGGRASPERPGKSRQRPQIKL